MQNNIENDDSEQSLANENSNDEIIGIAFRKSVIAIVVLATILIVFYQIISVTNKEKEILIHEADNRPNQKYQTAAAQQVPLIDFSDITLDAGIDFIHYNGAYGEKLLPETMGSGVAFLDYNNDSYQDLLFINATDWPETPGKKNDHSTLALYKNNGKGQFQDVTSETGLEQEFYGTGVAVGDYDNDGFVDIFIGAVGHNYLFHNNNGSFENVTDKAGVAGAQDAWSTGSLFFDYDNDGDLDLFVGNYIKWSKDIDLEVDYQLTGIGRAYGPPTAYEGTHSYLYRNDGDGKFTDVSAESGIQINNPATGTPISKTLAITALDFNNDGFLDVFVANDTVQNFLLQNMGDGTFKDVGVNYGIAFDRYGSATGAMGVDVANLLNDGNIGIAVGNFANEMTSLYMSDGAGGNFADGSIIEGIGPATRLVLSFGLFFFDFDLDGRLDLFQANGHLEEEINSVQSSQHYKQQIQLFWNCGNDCSVSYIAVQNTAAFSNALVARGASYADIDADGDLDIVVTQVNARPVLFKNNQTTGHHWLRVKLIGTHTNRDAIGAVVELVTKNGVQRQRVMPTRSYLSSVELPLTFGLGTNTEIEELRIYWSDGSIQTLSDVPTDRAIVIEQD